MGLRELLIKHEGIRLKPYRDSVGKLTIGVGRNLEDNGITEFEAMMMLSNDIDRTLRECTRTFAWFKSINNTRQDVVISMIFNMGMAKFQGFTQMIARITEGNFNKAADEMLDSLWAKQVGIRATELAKMMRTGKDIL